MVGPRRSPVPPKLSPTLRAFSRQYLRHVEAHLSPTTLDRYRSALSKWLLPTFGRRRLDEISAAELQDYADERARAAKPATVRHEIMLLSSMLARARRWDLCRTNPVPLVEIPAIENTIVRYLSPEERERLLAAAKEPLRTAIIVALHSGLREGEQCRLTWDDVRIDEGLLIVRHTKFRRDRTVPMNATLKAAFAGIKRVPGCPYVFVSRKTGRSVSRFNTTAWRNLLRRCGVRQLRWHDLRHAFASALAQAGTPMLVIKDLLGHGSLQMTSRYAHLSPENLRDAVLLLDETVSAPTAAKGESRSRDAHNGAQRDLFDPGTW